MCCWWLKCIAHRVGVTFWGFHDDAHSKESTALPNCLPSQLSVLKDCKQLAHVISRNSISYEWFEDFRNMFRKGFVCYITLIISFLNLDPRRQIYQEAHKIFGLKSMPKNSSSLTTCAGHRANIYTPSHLPQHAIEFNFKAINTSRNAQVWSFPSAAYNLAQTHLKINSMHQFWKASTHMLAINKCAAKVWQM